MSITYTDDTVTPRMGSSEDAEFVPSYARRSVRKTKKVKTWMVLAPIAAIALIGGGAAMMMNSGGETQPLAEPAVAPVVAAPVAASPAPAATPSDSLMARAGTPELVTPNPASAPVRQAEPVRRASPPAVRRDAPPSARTVTPRAESPVVSTTLQAYSAGTAATSSSVAAPAAAQATPTPPAPAIVVAPLS